MRIADLDYLNNLSTLENIFGGGASNVLTLSFGGGGLSLSLGSNTLFQTTLPQTLLGYSVNFDSAPGLKVVVNRTTTVGVNTTSSSSTIVGILLQPGSSTTFAFASSSTTLS